MSKQLGLKSHQQVLVCQRWPAPRIDPSNKEISNSKFALKHSPFLQPLLSLEHCHGDMRVYFSWRVALLTLFLDSRLQGGALPERGDDFLCILHGHGRQPVRRDLLTMLISLLVLHACFLFNLLKELHQMIQVHCLPGSQNTLQRKPYTHNRTLCSPNTLLQKHLSSPALRHIVVCERLSAFTAR